MSVTVIANTGLTLTLPVLGWILTAVLVHKIVQWKNGGE